MGLMTFVGNLLSGGAIDKVVDLVKDYQAKKLTKEELQFRIETLAETQAHDLRLAQISVNKQEAEHSNTFVSGWRPFIGWVCGLGFTVNFLIAPFITFIAQMAGKEIIFPQADLSQMMPVLLGMLGLGVYRSYEKVKGVARDK